jgi:hypothetical protein
VNDFQKLVLMPGKNERINAFTTILYPIKAIKYNIFKKRNLKLLRLILALDNACMKTLRKLDIFGLVYSEYA